MRLPLSAKFVEKAEAALVAAIEIYNKPSFHYREETFSLLAINAWELLLKAQLLKCGNNDLKVIRVYEQRRTRAGKTSKKLYLKHNRAGAPLTLSLPACIIALDKDADVRLAPEIRANLDALIAVRDNAAHYINASPILARQVLEIATATIKYFVILSKTRLSRNFDDSLSIVLPLSFIGERKHIDSVVVTDGGNRLIKYLQGLGAAEPVQGAQYSVAVRVQVKFERFKLSTASKVQIANDPDAVKVVLTEEDLRDRYPWDYRALTAKCAERYSDFRLIAKFHTLRKPLLEK